MQGSHNTAQFKEWAAKAQDDEDAAEILLKERGPFSPVCFHAQQMAEKLLKGFLAYHDIEFRRVHDLVELAGMLKTIVPNILTSLAEDLTLLNRFYIESRYPADIPEFTYGDAQKAFEAAKRVRQFIMGKID